MSSTSLRLKVCRRVAQAVPRKKGTGRAACPVCLIHRNDFDTAQGIGNRAALLNHLLEPLDVLGR